MKALVCGGRDYANREIVFEILDAMHSVVTITAVIDGAATGADSLASEWARDKNIPNRRFPADWQQHKRRAGYLRNKQMLDESDPDFVIAFPGGTGTAMMIKLARKAGVTYMKFLIKVLFRWCNEREDPDPRPR